MRNVFIKTASCPSENYIILPRSRVLIVMITFVSCLTWYCLWSVPISLSAGNDTPYSIIIKDQAKTTTPPAAAEKRFMQQPLQNKTILYFNKWWRKSDFGWGEGDGPFKAFNCPIQACFATSNRNYLSSMGDFDAVIFHGHRDQVSYNDYRGVGSWRRPNQRFLIMVLESPLFGSIVPLREQDMVEPFLGQRDPYDDFFNWTISYRWDADIVRPYGWFAKKDSQDFYPSLPDEWVPYDKARFITSLQQKPKDFLSLNERPKMVAWVVSKCNSASLRGQYVNELKKYISVDVFGACGTPCKASYSASGVDDSCTLAVERDYKFYLSFENALCEDYVTEKFFTRMTRSLVVVLGQANYSRVAPPHSHLNVMDYSSPKELADHLHQLANDRLEYLSYFWWQDYYKVTRNEQQSHEQVLCKICEKLHDTTSPISSYSDLQRWWNTKADCNRDMPSLRQKIGLES